MRMGVEEWWPVLTERTRSWLTAHAGEPIPAPLVGEIVRASGEPADSDAWWVDEVGADGSATPADVFVDFLEAAANEE